MSRRNRCSKQDGGSPRRFIVQFCLAAFLVLDAASVAHAGEPIRIGFVDAISGSFANVGEGGLLVRAGRCA